MLLDAANSPPEVRLFEHLRQEIKVALSNAKDWGEPHGFKKLMYTDSVVRECLRYHPILIKGLTREVVPSAGVTLPDGTHLPKGTWVGVPNLGIHRDDRHYPRPEVFEPFRFVKSELKNGEKKVVSWEDEQEAARPTTTYVGFGYGRHAW